MSKSRRGLLAAGLATAVVGSMGVVWTLGANADEISDAEAPAAIVASADVSAPTADVTAPAADVIAPAADVTAPAADVTEPAPEVTDEPAPIPPKLLPWGAEPEPLVRAEPGASSEDVAEANADAAPADTSGSLEPEPEFAPKGRSSRSSTLESMRTTLVPPAPPSVTKTSTAAASEVYFHYAVGTQIGDTDGTWANLTIEKPRLVEGDFHTLAELAVQSADGQQIVEVGWNVDRSVNGDSDPHLFVFYWKDRQPQCYNACGFTMYSKTVKPGDTLPVGASKRFGIVHASGVWWIAYDSEFIGYFPDRNWDGRYTRGGLVQWFGEVASSTATPCTQMGNGLPAGDGTAARIGSISQTNGPPVKFDPRATSAMYSVNVRSETTFRYGGPFYPPQDPNDPNSPPTVQC